MSNYHGADHKAANVEAVPAHDAVAAAEIAAVNAEQPASSVVGE